MRDFTTLRKLGKHRDQYFSAVVRWNDQVFFAAPAKNGGYLARIYEMVDLEDNVVRETEKAILVKVFGFNTKTYNEGNVEKWIPKSVLMTKEEVETTKAI